MVSEEFVANFVFYLFAVVESLQCESKKSSPPKTFCSIFSPGEPV